MKNKKRLFKNMVDEAGLCSRCGSIECAICSKDLKKRVIELLKILYEQEKVSESKHAEILCLCGDKVNHKDIMRGYKIGIGLSKLIVEETFKELLDDEIFGEENVQKDKGKNE